MSAPTPPATEVPAMREDVTVLITRVLAALYLLLAAVPVG